MATAAEWTRSELVEFVELVELVEFIEFIGFVELLRHAGLDPASSFK